MLYREIEAIFEGNSDRETYVPVAEDEFSGVICGLGDKDIILIALFAVADFQGHTGITLMYVFERRGRAPLVIMRAAACRKQGDLGGLDVSQCLLV